ncbi:malonic semialdehyde reductase [Robbsia andropogonis]|uniref:Malonic semialdehyde reductase n=1 Tax=Robbsia andropogonis TaxID=28092 RepID=A0A0F5K1N5_9BURK|nr:malonic semialdehyde reductase [Robbsia andropogonis]KKB63467.1 malonic semialdehyde reductase [Robbsia andropogonis]MCP1120375.1 malonic semialdehyde reductase [Robbsia andropogonis]MCP1130271.1 malonic semialdehyde reductase [Robbsia andropogonis]
MTILIDPIIFSRPFTEAHTANRFTDEPVSDDALHMLYEAAKFGPTSMNCQPMRLIFVRGAEAKARLCAVLAPGNVEKTMAAPVTVIVAMDKQFHEQMASQFPAMPNAAGMFAANPALAEETALRNATLQGAYLMIAARLAGFSVGPMSGFDRAGVDAAFFAGTEWRANFLFNLGVADPAGFRPRGPRLSFDEVARIV